MDNRRGPELSPPRWLRSETDRMLARIEALAQDVCAHIRQSATIEDLIWAAAYARTVYPLHETEEAEAVDAVVESATRYADRIVAQYRQAKAARGGQ